MGLLATLMATPVSAAPGIKLDVLVGNICVLAQGPANTRHELSLRAPDGTLRARTSDRSEESGYVVLCVFNGSLLTVINPGDIVIVRAGDLRKRVVVPDILPRIDRATDVVRGHVEPAGRLHVDTQPQSSRERTFAVPIAPDGSWRLDTTDELDLVGGDLIQVRWRVRGDTFSTLAAVPYLEMSPQTNIVYGAGRPGSRVTVEVDRGGTTVASAAALGFIGSFQAVLETGNGRAVYPRTGDVVSANVAGGIELTVPRWSLRAVGLEDTVSGRCMADSAFVVEVSSPFDFEATIRRGTTDAAGHFQRRVDALKKGDTVTLTCLYPGGDRLVIERTAD